MRATDRRGASGRRPSFLISTMPSAAGAGVPGRGARAGRPIARRQSWSHRAAAHATAAGRGCGAPCRRGRPLGTSPRSTAVRSLEFPHQAPGPGIPRSRPLTAGPTVSFIVFQSDMTTPSKPHSLFEHTEQEVPLRGGVLAVHEVVRRHHPCARRLRPPPPRTAADRPLGECVRRRGHRW